MLNLVIGRYKLEKWLGGGRFGDVYYAIDTVLGKPFALKVLRVTQESLPDVLEEARLLFSLDHPNIVRFFNIDVIEGRLIIVTEYIEGVSLRTLIKREAPFAVERVIFYAEQLASALDYAHGKNIVHRDVKPENIMITKDGKLKLVDFGIAKVFEKEVSMSIGGTPSYMAPEAWRGLFSNETDIWSFSLVVLEMLTGKNPFMGENLEEIRLKVNTPFSIKAKFPFIDARIASVLEKGLSVDPTLRFSTCTELVQELKGETSSPVILVGSKEQLSSVGSFHNSFSKEQLDVTLARDKKILVIGGPGTGKTTVVAGRVVWLVKQGEDPSKIYVLTFNTRCARSLENMLRKDLGDTANLVNVCTVSEFALRIVARYGESVGFVFEGSVLSPLKKSYVLKKLIARAQKELNIPEAVAIEIYNRFRRIRNKSGNIDEFLENTTGRWNTVLKDFWNLYNNFLKSEGIFDYDDLTYLAVEILRTNPIALEEMRGRVEHLIVDDIQDLDALQVSLIKFFFDSAVLFFTCDDDQSIYSWRGANYNVLNSLVDSSFKVYMLTESFRLFDSLKDAALNVIRRNSSLFPKLVWTRKSANNFYFDIKAFETPQDEADFVADIIEILRIKEAYSYSDFAVLFRSNQKGRLIQQKLKSRGIPFSYQHVKTFHNREEIQFAISVLKYSINSTEYARRRVYSELYKVGLKRNSEIDVDIENLLSDIKGGCPSFIISHLIDFLSRHSGKESLEAFYKRIGILEEFYREALDFEKRSKTPTVASFLNYVKFLTDSGFSDSEDGVRLLSVYSAKGLEFPVVFVVGMVEGEFPSAKSLGFPEELEEERRLFFTAITRASEKLFITYYRFLSSYSRVEEKPSRFIQEMLGL